MSNNPTKRTVILGGGFAARYAAMELENTLARDPDVEITLVNCRRRVIVRENYARSLYFLDGRLAAKT